MADIGYVVFSDSTTTYYDNFNTAVAEALADPGAVFHVTALLTSDVYAQGVTTVFEGGSQKNIYGGASGAHVASTNITFSGGDYSLTSDNKATYVFGGGKNTGGTVDSVVVNVNDDIGTTKIANLFAGSWMTTTGADAGGTATVNVTAADDAHVLINSLYASPYTGNFATCTVNVSGGSVYNYSAAGANAGVRTKATLNLTGGTVFYIYAGSKSVIDTVELSEVNISGGYVNTLYGGNYFTSANKNYTAQVNAVDINVTGGSVAYVYLGHRQVTVTEGKTNTGHLHNVTFTLNGGTLGGPIYGGNYTTTQHLGDVTINLIAGTPTTDRTICYGTGAVGDFTQGHVTINVAGLNAPTQYVYGSYKSNATKVTMNVSAGSLDMLCGGDGATNGSSAAATSVTYTDGVEINVTGGSVFGLNGVTFYKTTLNTVNNGVVIDISGGSIGGVASRSMLTGVSNSSNLTVLNGDVSLTVRGDATIGSSTTACNVQGVGLGTANGDVSVTVAGGMVYGGVYGIGVSANGHAENADVFVSGGTITGNVQGLGTGTLLAGGTASVAISGGDIGGNVYATGSAAYTGNTSVTVSGGILKSDVYAGGGTGAITGDTYITMTGGALAEKKRIYGGSNAGNITGNTHVNIAGGTFASAFVFGGGDGSSTITGDTYVTVTGGNGGYNANGGSYGGIITGSTHVTVECGGQVQAILGGGYDTNDSVGFTDVVVRGKATSYVAGGGFRGSVVGDAENAGSTRIRIEGGSVMSNLFGGGYYASATVGSAARNGSTSIEIGAGTASDAYVAGNVYAGGLAGSVYGTTSVSLTSGTIAGHVYGACFQYSSGTNAADKGTGHVYGNAAISISGGTVKGSVYGGGRQGSDVSGTATVSITGGKFASGSRVFGGGDLTVAGDNAGAYNQASNVTLAGSVAVQRLSGGARVSAALDGSAAYTLSGSTSVTLSAGTVSQALVGRANVYGGASVADSGNTAIDISGGYARIVAGAGLVSAAATDYSYNGNVEIDVSGGTVDYLFGGNVGSQKEFCVGTAMTGNVAITVDTSVREVTLKYLYAGSNSSTDYEAYQAGNTLVTFTGLGSNLIWTEGGLSGDGAGKYGDIDKTQGFTRTLLFDDFSGVFNAPVISRFDVIAFEDSTVTFGTSSLYLSGVEKWNFSLGSSLIWNNARNSFAGDDLVFGAAGDTISTDWDVITSNNNKAFAGWDQLNSITLFGTALDTYDDDTLTWSAEGFGYVATWDDEDHKIVIAQA